MKVIQPVGQSIQPQPVMQIPQQAYTGLQNFWHRTRVECEKVFSPGQCQSLLGTRPTMLAPGEREGLAWYWLVLIGVGIGKVIL